MLLLQRGGYEVYIVEACESSSEVCHRRNNRSLDDVQRAAAEWQDTPAVYPLLDVESLLGSSKKKSKQVQQCSHLHRQVSTAHMPLYGRDHCFLSMLGTLIAHLHVGGSVWLVTVCVPQLWLVFAFAVHTLPAAGILLIHSMPRTL